MSRSRGGAPTCNLFATEGNTASLSLKSVPIELQLIYNWSPHYNRPQTHLVNTEFVKNRLLAAPCHSIQPESPALNSHGCRRSCAAVRLIEHRQLH